MMYAIQIKNLVKRFGDVTAIDDLSLNIKEGEIFGLLGPNDAGKSTTINILSGILQPTSGSAFVGGYDITVDPDNVKRLIGVCPQHSAYYNYLTGRENIKLFGDLHGMPKALIKERSTHLIEKIGLEEAADRKSSSYSGGMARRINLAMALINDPDIAFLDEPTVGMDPQSRRATWDFIEEFRKSGKTVILTTHYIEEAEELTDRVGIIDHGMLIALDTPQALMEVNGGDNLEEVFIGLTGRKIREAI
ncbi:ATP-binding cassette domain-containing protein [Candidatus Bathyarchaeota archaeon]|nr:MAG: ATP-binding cassette domain-containing protein [Candidatus Bathyarchaeota archaeon]